MKQSLLLPTVYPLKPDDIPIEVLSEHNLVYRIETVIDDVVISFARNIEGRFEPENENDIEPSYLAYIVRLLNRRFGGG